MHRRKRALLIVLAVCCMLCTQAFASEGFLYNADFSVSEDGILPDGWWYDAWITENDAPVWMEGDAVFLENTVENDARICQQVAVEPNSLYKITCEIMAAGVIGDAGATLSVMDTFASSEQQFDTDGQWQQVTLIGETGEDQTEITVALRLGGYGALSTGVAGFRQVKMEKLAALGAGERAQNLTFVEASKSTQTADADVTVFFKMILAALVTGLAFVAVYHRVFLGKEGKPVTELNMKVALLLGAAFMVRAVCSVLVEGHSTDISCFMAWANTLAENGLSGFYAPEVFADYPPGYMYFLYVIGSIRKVLNLSFQNPLFLLLLKLPSIAADLLLSLFACRVAKNQGWKQDKVLAVTALVAFNPVILYISSCWGQIDSLLALCLFGTMLLFQKEKRILAGALYGFAILLKPQALMVGPLLAVAYFLTLKKPGILKKLLELVLSVAAAVGVILLLALPFAPEPGFGWLLEKYFATATSYPFASIEGFNLPALFGGNWKPVQAKLFGLSYAVWGTIGIVLSVVVSVIMYWKNHKRGKAPLMLCGAFLLIALFTLGHYMHERYIFPALILLLFAYLYYDDRRLLVSYCYFSCTLLLNALAAIVIVDHQHLRGNGYDLLTYFGSAATVIGFIYLCYVYIDLIFLGRRSPTVLTKKSHTSQQTEASIVPLSLHEFESGREKLRFVRKDRLFCWGLTAVYALFALTNLGSFIAPQTYYYSDTPGETAVVTFDAPETLSEIWVYGGLTEGQLSIEADHGQSVSFEQLNTDMYRWVVVDVSSLGQVNALTLRTGLGALWLNEIACFNGEGQLLSAEVRGPAAGARGNNASARQSGGAIALLDEQDTVPEYPSYYNGMYFDELYHARTAYEHLHGIFPYENSHPPLGKVIMMLGIAIFGMVPFGWRIMGALAGIIMVPVFYALARRLFGKPEYALLSAGLFAFDFMHFTQTRIATIDSYSVLFILLMFYFMYEYYTMNYYRDGLKATLKPLALAGLFFGLGAATKWICIYAGGGLAVLLFLSLYQRYREAKRSEKMRLFWHNTVLTLLWCCLFYIIVPVAIYLLSYLPYHLSEEHTTLLGIWEYQNFMWTYHSGLTATHPYQAAWWQWPFTLKPMWYYWGGNVPKGYVSTLTASGNPAVWWFSTILTGVLFTCSAAKKVPARPGMAVAYVGVCANFLPWVLVTRSTFIYHFFASVPFVLLCGVYALWHFENVYGEVKGVRTIKWVWLGIGILLFLLLYPGLTGTLIPGWYANFLKYVPGGHLMYGV